MVCLTLPENLLYQVDLSKPIAVDLPVIYVGNEIHNQVHAPGGHWHHIQHSRNFPPFAGQLLIDEKDCHHEKISSCPQLVYQKLILWHQGVHPNIQVWFPHSTTDLHPRMRTTMYRLGISTNDWMLTFFPVITSYSLL